MPSKSQHPIQSPQVPRGVIFDQSQRVLSAAQRGPIHKCRTPHLLKNQTDLKSYLLTESRKQSLTEIPERILEKGAGVPTEIS